MAKENKKIQDGAMDDCLSVPPSCIFSVSVCFWGLIRSFPLQFTHEELSNISQSAGDALPTFLLSSSSSDTQET